MAKPRRVTRAYRDWRVYAAPLRPGMSQIIEIHDALGNVIVSWGGFDGCDYSYTQSLKNARFLVKAVNAFNGDSNG